MAEQLALQLEKIKKGLGEYAEKLFEDGWEELEDLQDCEFEDLTKHGIKTGYARKIMRTVNKLFDTEPQQIEQKEDTSLHSHRQQIEREETPNTHILASKEKQSNTAKQNENEDPNTNNSTTATTSKQSKQRKRGVPYVVTRTSANRNEHWMRAFHALCGEFELFDIRIICDGGVAAYYQQHQHKMRKKPKYNTTKHLIDWLATNYVGVCVDKHNVLSGERRELEPDIITNVVKCPNCPIPGALMLSWTKANSKINVSAVVKHYKDIHGKIYTKIETLQLEMCAPDYNPDNTQPKFTEEEDQRLPSNYMRGRLLLNYWRSDDIGFNPDKEAAWLSEHSSSRTRKKEEIPRNILWSFDWTDRNCMIADKYRRKGNSSSMAPQSTLSEVEAAAIQNENKELQTKLFNRCITKQKYEAIQKLMKKGKKHHKPSPKSRNKKVKEEDSAGSSEEGNSSETEQMSEEGNSSESEQMSEHDSSSSTELQETRKRKKKRVDSNIDRKRVKREANKNNLPPKKEKTKTNKSKKKKRTKKKKTRSTKNKPKDSSSENELDTLKVPEHPHTLTRFEMLPNDVEFLDCSMCLDEASRIWDDDMYWGCQDCVYDICMECAKPYYNDK
eukprot:56072_1